MNLTAEQKDQLAAADKELGEPETDAPTEWWQEKIQTLLERGLVESVGRAEVVGRPMTYGTTPLFLEYFGLRSLEDLPAADELRRIVVEKPEACHGGVVNSRVILAEAQWQRFNPGLQIQ